MTTRREPPTAAEIAADATEPRVTFLPVAGKSQIGGRVGAGLHFVPDGKGGGKLYQNAQPGARMIARVRRWP